MCRQMAPPQKELASRTPSDEVRGTSNRTAVVSSPAPITVIHPVRPSFATASGGNRPRTLAEPARIMIPATRPCSTRPVIVFQFQVVFIVQLLSEEWVTAGRVYGLGAGRPAPRRPLEPSAALRTRAARLQSSTHRR